VTNDLGLGRIQRYFKQIVSGHGCITFRRCIGEIRDLSPGYARVVWHGDYQHFGGAYRFHVHHFYPEDDDSKFLRNLPTTLHGLISQETIILTFTAMGTPDLIKVSKMVNPTENPLLNLENY
jgi:hypothetical protein